MALTWTLEGRGWAKCTVTDEQTQAEVTASYLSSAPEDLLTAVMRLVLGDNETRAQFEAEPTAFRWIFSRDGNDVWVQLLELTDGRRHDKAGTKIWSSRQAIDSVARAVIRCFDEVVWRYGASSYQDKWGQPFPRIELEALRTAWRNQRRGTTPGAPPNP
jgi:hypothetical protein